MRIILIAPFPPPITGQSLAVKVFHDALIRKHEVNVVNLSKNSLKNGVNSYSRIVQIFKIFKEVWVKSKFADVIYFTISESIAGNLKDLIIYLICYRSLHKMVIHLHGGSIRKLLFDKHKLLFIINCFFIRRLGSITVLGQSHVGIFSDIVSGEKIQIVPNFAEDYIFIDEDGIINKFSSITPLKILFLSNLIYGKGHNELVEAFMALDDNLKQQITIDFAGSFESESQKEEFLKRIKIHQQIHYHDVVVGAEKSNLLSGAHLLCLPTCLSEGQPISILEAYASGCVVMTTNQGGICDIFKDKINGFEIQKKSADSIKAVIEQIIKAPEQLLPLAMTNRKIADAKYRTSNYSASLLKIIEGVSV